MSSTLDPICKGWRNFLIEAAFAKDYKTPYVIESSGPVVNNPILDSLLPSLLIVKLASLVDEALSEYISRKNLTMPKMYRTDFNGKIKFLGDNGHLKDAAGLHKLRNLRNDLTHEPRGKATWNELETAIEAADEELQYLEFVEPRPRFEVSAERVSVEPVDPKYLMSFNYSVILKSEGKKVAEFTWSKHLHRDDE